MIPEEYSYSRALLVVATSNPDILGIPEPFPTPPGYHRSDLLLIVELNRCRIVLIHTADPLLDETMLPA